MTTTAMLDPRRPIYDATMTLGVNVPTVLVFDLRDSPTRDISVEINNTGANAIGTTKVELGHTEEDASYVELTTVGSTIGSTAAAAKATYEKFDDARRFVRVTLTSLLGTTARVQAATR